MVDDAAASGRQGERAGIISRVVANVVDGAVILTIGGLLLLGTALVLFFVTQQPFHIPTIPRWIELPVTTVLVAGYFAYGWSGTERTVGQYVMGLRVLGIDGRVLTLRQALVRTVAYMLLPLGLAWAIVSRRDASLQDLALRTKVVYDWSHRRPVVAPQPLAGTAASEPLVPGHNGRAPASVPAPPAHTTE